MRGELGDRDAIGAGIRQVSVPRGLSDATPMGGGAA